MQSKFFKLCCTAWAYGHVSSTTKDVSTHVKDSYISVENKTIPFPLSPSPDCYDNFSVQKHPLHLQVWGVLTKTLSVGTLVLCIAQLIQAEHAPPHTASLLPHSSVPWGTQTSPPHFPFNAASLQISYSFSKRLFDGWECLQQFFWHV